MVRSTRFLSAVAVLLCLVVVRSGYVAVSGAKGNELEQPAPAHSTAADAQDEEKGSSPQSEAIRTGSLLGLDGSSLSVWSQDLTYNKGWRVDQHPRLVGNFNGDDRADIVGFGNQSVLVAITDSPNELFIPLVTRHGSGLH